MSRVSKVVQQIEDSAAEKPEVDDKERFKDLIPFGSTLVNLACSDRAAGAFVPGEMVNLIGDSNSGKTLAAFTIFAEMSRHPKWDEYEFVYDDVEAANCFDVAKLFGSRVSGRLQEAESGTIEEFQQGILKRLQGDKPFVYILDSLDALTSEEEVQRGEKIAEGKEVTGGNYATKAKTLKQILRLIVRELRKSRSLLVIISQTIDNIGGGPWGPKKSRAGGNALRFFASHELWLSLGEKIKVKERVIGVETKLRVARSKLTGKTRTVSFNIYYDYGIDDIGSCVDFMVAEGFWEKPAKSPTITAPDLDLRGTRDAIIKQIESGDLEPKLRRTVGRAWGDIEESLRLGRKPKYA